MNSFFKMFFAALLALVVFWMIGFFIFIAGVAMLTSKEETKVPDKTVLSINLSEHFNERAVNNPLDVVTGNGSDKPGLYDVIRLVRHAARDKKIAGIYLTANGNSNGFAASEELRNALLEFKQTDKFIIAHGDVMSQKAYYVASVADRIYLNPAGSLDWSGLSMQLVFFKGTLEKLKIEPQIFYAGKFKSATEPFRTDRMTEENKLQTIEWLGDIYHHFLKTASEARGIDTATLHALADSASIRTADDAVKYKLVDGLKYDDQVKDEIKKNLNIGKYGKFSMMSLDAYEEAGNYKATGSGRIALIYAEGNIVDGNGDKQSIGGDAYVKMIRKVRLDKSIKAIVFRINSGGGSALASEKIWRELELAKKDKPVVVSFGDVAASGGYYIAAGADSIFASPNTITGSIGVFGIIPNMQGFFNDKLGMTFDGVKTAQYADLGAIYRPLNENEKKIIQQGVDRIYLQFKQRVAEGRKKDIGMVDSIAQGRVWSGEDALRLGLVDNIGGLHRAVQSAARLAKLKDYRLREYPSTGSWVDELLGKASRDPEIMMREKLGEENYTLYKEMVEIRQLCGVPQSRLPFRFFID